ncbi:DUF2723 domain-containing protein [bacterium]|nr:DUF2723 domain-containing protein [bacterium]
MSSIAEAKPLDSNIIKGDYGVPKWWYPLRNITAFIVFLITFMIYFLTAQASVPFWDCGEFIACSYTLGVPHPPGAPLFIIWGRLVSLLPLGVEVARKLNWMSSFFNALAIGIIFLMLSRIINRWFGQVKNWVQAIIVISGSAAGAFFAGLGDTYWNNGVEAEVYGFAMFITALVAYLAILWSERHKDPRADRYILLIAYLMYLGIGAHMTTMIMLPPLFLFFLVADKSKRYNPVFWLTWFVIFLVATEFNMFVENMMTAIVVFFLAAVLTNNIAGKRTFQVIVGIWALIQLFLIFYHPLKAPGSGMGTTIPGLMFKQYGLSGSSPNMMNAFIQFVILASSLIIVSTKNYIRQWRLGFFTILLCVIAFSLNTYTLIRSRANPYVDENDPQTIKEFRDYMDRKQYGQESMWTLMFKRKGTWKNQFGTHIRMGFWGFFRRQWINPEKIPLKYTLNGWIFFIFGLLGAAYAIYRHPKWGYLIFLVTLVSTLGLLIYLNFSDGSSYMHLEVRDRDYFYTPGFMFFGALIGLGISALLSFIYRGWKEFLTFLSKIGYIVFFTVSASSLILMALTKSDVPYFLGVAVATFILGMLCTFIKPRPAEHTVSSSGLKNAVIVLLSVIFLISPAVGVTTNWFKNDRSRNYIPFDYAFNILDSCDKNSVIFTNGDNDTFPLWFLQTVPRIRTDVRIVNLSLLNTNWYIKQIKHNMGVPVKMTDEQIDRLHPYRDAETGKIIRVQDIMVRHIIENTPLKMKIDTTTGDTTYYLDPPVFFAVTVAPENKVGYDPYLEMEGLVYRVTTTKGDHKVNVDKMRYNLFERYQYRGLKDPTIYKDENSRKLLQNYTTGFITLAYEYRRMQDTTNALATINKMKEVLPFEWRANSFAAEFYSWAGRWDLVDEEYQEALKNLSEQKHPDKGQAKLFQMYFQIYYRNKKYDKAEKALKDGLKIYPDDRELFRAYMSFLYDRRYDDKLKSALADWVARHPDDEQMNEFYQQVNQGLLNISRQKEQAEKESAATTIKVKKAQKSTDVKVADTIPQTK